MNTSLLITLVVVVLIAVVGLMIAWKPCRPFLGAILIVALIGSGVLSGLTAIKYYTTHSSTIGTLEEHDPYEDFNFYEYEITPFALQKNAKTGTYYYTTTYAKSIEFNGTENKYILMINNKPCDITMSDYGKLRGTTTIRFDDVDGQELYAIDIEILFIFYSNSITLQIDTSATDENASMLEAYFKINKCELRIINEVEVNAPILSNSALAV